MYFKLVPFLLTVIFSLFQISDIFLTALNQGLVQFELKANICVVVYVTQQTLGKFSFYMFYITISQSVLIYFYSDVTETHKKIHLTQIPHALGLR